MLGSTQTGLAFAIVILVDVFELVRDGIDSIKGPDHAVHEYLDLRTYVR